MTNIKFNDFLEEQLKDDSLKKEFEELQARSKQAVAVMLEREAMGYSQRELAELAQLPQTTVARIEKGANTSIATLSKIAHALGKELTISFT